MCQQVSRNTVWRLTPLLVLTATPALILPSIYSNHILLIAAFLTLPVLLAIFVAARRGIWTSTTLALFLLSLPGANRAFIPRAESVEATNLVWDPLAVAEVAVTLTIFVSSAFLFLWQPRKPRSTFIPVSLRLLGLYAIIAAGSLLYTPSISYSGFWLLRLVSALFLLAVYFGSGEAADPVRLAKVTLIAVMPYLFLPWVWFVQEPASFVGRAGGYWLHPIQASAIGYAAAMAFLLMWLQKTLKGFALILGFFTLITAYLTGGKAPAVAMTIVLVFVVAGNWRIAFSARGTGAAALSGLAITIVAWRAGVGLLNHLQVYQESGSDSLGVRFLLWRTAIPMWLDSPILGNGFASTRIIPISSLGGMTATHAHNSFLQALVEVGLLGSIPVFLAIALVVLRTLKLGACAFR